MSVERNRNNSFAKLRNPLFVYPLDGPGSLDLKIKLIKSSKFRSWKRCIEIALAMKRKLPFIHRTIARPEDDLMKGQWDACNNLSMAWIMGSVSDSIVESILYIESASTIWTHLEKRFAIGNGSRKYKFNKDIYNVKQNETPINEYYTRMRGIWEKLSAMAYLPRFTNINE